MSVWGWIYRQDNFWEFLGMFQHPAFIGRGQLSDNLDKLAESAIAVHLINIISVPRCMGRRCSLFCADCTWNFILNYLRQFSLSFGSCLCVNRRNRYLDLMKPAYKYLVLVMHCICVSLFSWCLLFFYHQSNFDEWNLSILNIFFSLPPHILNVSYLVHTFSLVFNSLF